MAQAFTKTAEWDDGQRLHVIGTIAASSSYATGGEAPSSFVCKGTTKSPIHVEIHGKAGYIYVYNRATGKVMVFYGDYSNGSDGPLVELPAASYPAGITGDVIDVHAIFPKFG